jgi:L-fucose isomerase-like protein
VVNAADVVLGLIDVNGAKSPSLSKLSQMAIENNNVTEKALENAARAYYALKRILEDENADAVTMNCLRKGMLKPCIGFSMLNSQLIPATCENDLNAAYGQMLAQLLVNRPGFQHNPAYNTEENRYYASHCTCPTKLYGPDGEDMKYRLTRFLHTNEGSCAIQVFWKPGDPVTMIHYYSGKEPKLDIYSGMVFKSHQELVGCATNVEISITDRENANFVQGHHNILICGNLSKIFKDFARLYKLQIMESVV